MFTTVLIFIVVAVVSYFGLSSYRRNGALPPGIYGWPVIGHIPSFKKPFVESVEEMRKKFGDIFLWRMGSRDFLFVCDYELVKSTLNNPYLQDRPDTFLILFLADGKFSGISLNNGDSWHKIRKLTLKYLKERGVGKSSLMPEIEFERDYLIKELKQMAKKDRNIAPWCINTAITNVIWKMCADKRYDIHDKDFQHFQKLINDSLNDLQTPVNMALDFMPWLEKVIPSFMRSWIGIGDSGKLQLILDYLRDTVNEAVVNKDPSRPQTIIDVYLEEMEKGKKSEYYGALNEKDLLITLNDLFTNGGDTTAATIKWIFVYLTKYPHIQQKIFEEISSIVPYDRYPCIDDKLPYTTAVFYEVMRLQPILPCDFYHCASKDTKLGKFLIPKGTIIMPCLYACQTDPKLFKKPKEFYPEHFLNEDGSLNSKPEGFMPFGMGSRVCIGQSLAKSNLQILVPSILQQFEIKSADEKEISKNSSHFDPIFNFPPEIKFQFCERA